MSKIRRRVTVENSKTISDSSSSQTSTTPSRRPSVFERLGPSTGSNAVEVCTSTPASNPLTDTSHACPEKVEKEHLWVLDSSEQNPISASWNDTFLLSSFQTNCRNWLKTGNCSYGNTCRYTHGTQPRGKGFSGSFSRLDGLGELPVTRVCRQLKNIYFMQVGNTVRRSQYSLMAVSYCIW